MKTAPLQVGDTIAVVRSGHSPGAHDAAARVLAVIACADTDEYAYRVAWNGGSETIFRPGRDVRVLSRGSGRGSEDR
jgi:hypothetical protein